VTDAAELLRQAKTVLLIDWPSRDVPDTLARSGYDVFSDEGPGRGYTAYEMSGDTVTTKTVRDPDRVDIVYAHRPIDELPHIIERALAMGAKAIWLQSGRDAAGDRDPRGCWLPPAESNRARELVESAGLTYVEEPYIAEAAKLTT
jgi:predicted CoA-binding protein